MEGTHKDLLSSIRSLPRELKDMIQKEYIRAVLQPGRVYAGDSASIEMIPGNILAIRPGVVEVLEIQDATMRKLARDIFYTQNTWVVAEGPLSTVDFLIQPPMPATLDISRIISIDFSFSCQDTEWILEDRPDFFRRKRIQCDVQRLAHAYGTVLAGEVQYGKPPASSSPETRFPELL
ncbi:hypothetical protein MMC15_008334 [Xylographa vitiligo]|nr:hypothetical protein [Xylographa vitiligo]